MDTHTDPHDQPEPLGGTGIVRRAWHDRDRYVGTVAPTTPRLVSNGTHNLNATSVREVLVRNENQEIPEKGVKSRKGEIPKMDLTFFSLLEVLTGYCKMLLSTILK
jgi:hypothetical protein